MRRRDPFVASTLGEFGGRHYSFLIQIFFIKNTANYQLVKYIYSLTIKNVELGLTLLFLEEIYIKQKLIPMPFTSQLALSLLNIGSAGQLKYKRI